MIPVIESNPSPENTCGLATKGYVWAVVSSTSGSLNNIQSVNWVYPDLTTHNVMVSSIYSSSSENIPTQINGDLTALSGNARLNILTDANYADIEYKILDKVEPLCADYSTTKETITTLSGNWNSAANETISTSSNWNQGYSSAKSTSANSNSVYKSVKAASASWNQTYWLLAASSGNWNGTYETVCSMSGTWDSPKTILEELSGKWNSAYTTTSSNSGNWNSAYTTVSSASATWDGDRELIKSQMYVKLIKDGLYTKTFADSYLGDTYTFTHSSYSSETASKMDSTGYGLRLNMGEYLRKYDAYFDKMNVLKISFKSLSIAPVGVTVEKGALGFYNSDGELLLCSDSKDIDRGSRQRFTNVKFTFDESVLLDPYETYDIYLIDYLTHEKLEYDFSLPWDNADSFTLTSFCYLGKNSATFANGKIFKGESEFNVYYKFNDVKIAEDSQKVGINALSGKVFDFSTASAMYASLSAIITMMGGTALNAFHTVTFNTDGGSSVSSQAVYYGGKASRPTSPTKEGRQFVDWYTTAACTTLFDFDNTAITSDITVYAKYANYLTITAVDGGVTVSLKTRVRTKLEYNKNDTGWIDATELTQAATTLDNAGDYVRFRGTGVDTAGGSYGFTFTEGKRVNASGSVASLVDSFGIDEYVVMPEHAFAYLFNNCTGLLTAPELIAKSATRSCYEWMFGGCTGLTAAPSLPAEELGIDCYNSMFCNCTNITRAPELPALTLSTDCYNAMFSGCEKLEYLKCKFTDWGVLCTDNWLYGVSDEGTFVCDSQLAITERGSSTVPVNWTVQNF